MNETNRHEWVRKNLESLPSGLKILDAGAGEQRYKKYCTHLEYVSQDFAQYDGSGDGKGLQMKSFNARNVDIISDITSIPVPDESFDVVLCTEVIEHIPNPLLAFKEFSRILKPNGILLLTAPFCSISHYTPYYYATGFSPYYYQVHLPEYNFEIVEISANGNYFLYLYQELMRLPSIAHKYTDIKINFWERIKLKLTKSLLMKLSRHNRNSEELLCFGYHVKAIKK